MAFYSIKLYTKISDELRHELAYWLQLTWYMRAVRLWGCGIGVDMAGCGGCGAVGHGQLGSYRQRLHFRKAIAAEVPWYMAFVAWLGVEQGAVGGTGS